MTQWEVVSAKSQIGEAALKPVLEAMLRQFPFRILGFHSDNGREFINHIVAELLNKLLIEQTKSRPRRCNDDALVECKNGAVIRKHMGYGHIASEHAAAVQVFLPAILQPLLEFSSAVRRAGAGDQRQRKGEETVPLVCHSPGDPAPVTGRGRISEGRCDDPGGGRRRQTDMQAATAMQAAKRKLLASFPDRRTA
jgi:hypothetical protein